MRVLIAILLMAGAAQAQDVVPPEDALNLFRGFVVDYDDNTREAFRPDDTVTQQYTDGDCVNGIVYPRDGMLCFVYETDGEAEHCWSVEQDARGLAVRSQSGGSWFAITNLSKQPLTCDQPDLVG